MSPRHGPTVLPYHFVPLLEGERRGDVEVENFRKRRPGHLGHHRYAEGCHSGRLVCRLTTVTPTFVGAARHEDPESEGTAEISPFEIDGRPALPGSSLRGMISSVAETIAGSALRVLEDRSYSYRSDLRSQSLSAVGMVFKDEDEEGNANYSLLPITIPVVPMKHRPPEPPPQFEGWFGEPRVRVFIDSIDDKRRPLESYRRDRPEFYGMRLAASGALPPARFIKGVKNGRGLVLAQTPTNGTRRPRRWEEIPKDERDDYTRGIVRVMKDENDDRDLIKTRKHELFLPFPDGIEACKKFPISPLAVERFHALADERTAAHRPGKGPPLPYEPVGTLRNENGDSKDLRFRLKTGDLVYFEPAPNGNKVGKIALSSVWRERVERGGQPVTSTDFVAAVDPELVPFHEGRTKLTIAEQLFGFVAQETEGESEVPAQRRSRTDILAGRLRFADARLDPELDARGYRLPETTLRILDSPKPPSPAMYFAADGQYRAKSELAEGGSPLPAPSGRKFYVHQRWNPESGDDPPWQTADTTTGERQKVRVRPLRDQVEFTFHIDYDNLTDEELGLLLAALEPCGAAGRDSDEPEFLHKLGMGKPLGLGSVRVEVLGCFEVDRNTRYSPEGLFRPRYARSLVAPTASPRQWPDRYRTEREAAATADDDLRSLRQLAASWREAVPMALRRLGRERFAPGQVGWPRVESSQGETKSYEWFVSNDDPKKTRGRNALQPIGPTGWPRLPVLPDPDKK